LSDVVYSFSSAILSIVVVVCAQYSLSDGRQALSVET